MTSHTVLGLRLTVAWIGMVVAIGASATVAPAQQRQDPVADSLIGLWIDSVGGMETYHAFHAAAFTVTTELYDTLSGRLKRARPRYAWIKKGPLGEGTRVERWEAIGFIEQGFNGRDPAWAALDGELLPDTAKDTREALYVSRDLFYWLGLPFKLRDPGVHLAYHGLQERPGATWEGETPPGDRFHAVGVSFGAGVGEHQDVFTYYFPPGRGFPYEVTYVEEGRENLNRLVWGETRRVGEIRYPYVVRRDWLTPSGKRTKALVISDVVVNPEVAQGRFEVP
jgi:hypothetical protein